MIRHVVGLLAAGVVMGAAAMHGTLTQAASWDGAQAAPPTKGALRGVVTPIGPYSPGVTVRDTVYLSGQIGVDPATSQLVDGTEAQTRRVMENLAAVLKEAGLSFGHVVKTTIYMVDISEFAKVNDVYATYFPAGGVPPARSTVQVAALPRGARIEIDMVAVK